MDLKFDIRICDMWPEIKKRKCFGDLGLSWRITFYKKQNNELVPFPCLGALPN